MDGVPIPWQLKVTTKIVLSRLPVNYRLWAKLRLFRHGAMDKPARAYEIFRKHYDRVRPAEPFAMLELGPGDSIASGVIARAVGCSQSYLVDAGDFASKDVELYSQLGGFLREQGFAVPQFSSMADVLAYSHVKYMTSGLASLCEIPTNSVDFIFSHAVLEHLPKSQFEAMMRELRRIQRHTGKSSHSVDLKDHLGGALNNLRFSESRWEAPLFSKSGFYTNRIRFSQMIDMFSSAGFFPDILGVNRWQTLPTKRGEMNEEFRTLSDAELLVQDFDVLLR